ncbi:hypothetical protein ACFTXM_14625 [Streptomyces sp. NPDC056930]|uniref:hypothetical protein n=1 Tax=Streptomyces sp. NPDC056930 TaxID=3345967 RepID=UPI0036291585
MSEAFNSDPGVGYFNRYHSRTGGEARIRIATCVADFYNTRRLQGVSGYKSPIDYERDH